MQPSGATSSRTGVTHQILYLVDGYTAGHFATGIMHGAYHAGQWTPESRCMVDPSQHAMQV